MNGLDIHTYSHVTYMLIHAESSMAYCYMFKGEKENFKAALNPCNIYQPKEKPTQRSMPINITIEDSYKKVLNMNMTLTCSSFHLDGLNGSCQQLTLGGP